MGKRITYGVKQLPDHFFTPEIGEQILSSEKFVVNKYDCIIWDGTVDARGRPRKQFKFEGDWYNLLNLHRVVHQCFYGKVDPKLSMLHLCNNKLCCNPHHMVAATHKQNMAHQRFTLMKERKINHEGGHKARLSPEKKQRLREEILEGEKSLYRLAKDYRINHSVTIWHRNALRKEGLLVDV